MRPYYYLGANRGLTRLVSGQQFYVNTKDWNITPWIVDGGDWELFVDELRLAQRKKRVAVLEKRDSLKKSVPNPG